MNIGISTSVIQQGRSGIGRYVLSLLREMLSQLGSNRLTIFALEKDIPLFDFARENATIVSVPETYRSPMRDIAWHQSVLPRLVREHGIDVLHVPSYRRMLWPQPCALVATIHDLAPFQVRAKYDWKRMLYGRVVARQLARRQDAIITVSHTTQRAIERYFGISDDRVTVVYNGIDHMRFFEGPIVTARNFISQRFGLQRPYFLYVARLEHPAKNHVQLISAFERFKAESRMNWQLVFCGSDWQDAGAIHEAIRRSPYSSDIRNLGFVQDHELPMLYRGAGAFVYPSQYEGFGFPPLEAMACGTPVLCSPNGSLGEVVGDAALLVDPSNREELKERLWRIASDQILREQLRAAGMRRASQFDWKHTAAQTLGVYAQVVATARRNSEGMLLASQPSH